MPAVPYPDIQNHLYRPSHRHIPLESNLLYITSLALATLNNTRIHPHFSKQFVQVSPRPLSLDRLDFFRTLLSD